MRRITRMPVIGACVIALLLILVGSSAQVNGAAKAASGPYPGISEELVAVAETNDYCGEAEVIGPLIALPMPGQPPYEPDSYTTNVNDRTFHNGNNVDDWYAYTTHDLGCDTQLRVLVTSDKAQIEVEVYDYCFRWPLATSMYQEVWDGFESSIEILSGLEKDLTVRDVTPEFEYHIHVNVLNAPAEGGAITYDLTVIEECEPIAR